MGVETSVQYVCDIGGETTEDPMGWLMFSLTISPVVMSGEMPEGIVLGTTQNLVCPNHIMHVARVVSEGLADIPLGPTAPVEPPPEPAPAPEPDPAP